MRRSHRAARVGVVLTAAVVLTLAGGSWLVAWNAWTMTRAWRADVKIVVYLTDEGAIAPESVRAAIAAEPVVRSQRVVSRAEAEAEFLRAMQADRSLLEGLGEDVFPASIEVWLDESAQTPQAMGRLAARWSALPGVEDVRYGETLIRELGAAARLISIVGTVIGVGLAGGVVLVIGLMVDVSMYVRREEISLLRLLGAASTVVVKPFLLEGTATGALGGLMASAALGGAWWLIRVRAGSALDGIFKAWIDRLVFPLEFVPILIGLGALVGGLGSLMAVRRVHQSGH